MTYANRIVKLESKFSRDDAIKIVVVLEGESSSNALTRAGIAPNARGVVFMTLLDLDL